MLHTKHRGELGDPLRASLPPWVGGVQRQVPQLPVAALGTAGALSVVGQGAFVFPWGWARTLRPDLSTPKRVTSEADLWRDEVTPKAWFGVFPDVQGPVTKVPCIAGN